MSIITELIEKLKNYAQILEDTSTNNGSADLMCIKTMREAADTIEQLSAKLHAANMERSSQYYHGGWIPVEEVEHPQKEGLYWVHEQNYGGKEDAPLHDHAEHTLFWNGEVWLSSGRYYVDECSYIIAWYPLPEPYLPNEEE